MECNYQKLREDLCQLGYSECFPLEAVRLVSRLFADLKTTTSSLQKYMRIAQGAMEERDNLKLGAEPYRCNNAKLVKECNELHSQLIKCQEENEKIQKDLRLQLNLLETESRSLSLENDKLKKKLKHVQLDRILYQNQTKSEHRQQKIDLEEANSAMSSCDKKINNLSKEIRCLKQQHLELLNQNECMQHQLSNRDQEIDRLKKLLVGGRPEEAINKEFGPQDVLIKLRELQDEVNLSKAKNASLEDHLNESLATQHEAMQRALDLAEKNKQLMMEMQRVNRMAESAEAESKEKYTRVAQAAQHLEAKLQHLEMDNYKLQHEKGELKKCLDDCLSEKTGLAQKFNDLRIIENDLNLEIDSLQKQIGEQKMQILELQSEMLRKPNQSSAEKQDEEKIWERKSPEKLHKKVTEKKSFEKRKSLTKAKVTTKKTSNKNSAASPPLLTAPANTAQNICCGECCNSKHLRELLDREMENKQSQANKCIEAIKAEREYFMREYHKVLEGSKSSTTTSRPDIYYEVVQKLSDKDDLIKELQKEVDSLSHEKLVLMEKIEDGQKEAELCTKCKRLERELAIFQKEIEKLEEDRDCLMEKIKVLSQTNLEETEKLKQLIKDYEQKMEKLEYNRRELTYDQGSRQSALTKLENTCENLKEELRMAQSELNHQKIIYAQLKTLHEQTDRNLHETKYQLEEVETQLENALQELKMRDYSNVDVEKEVGLLKNDVKIMKTQLTQMDREKDELLNELDTKTEKLDLMEQELSSKNRTIQSLEEKVIEFRKKLASTLDGKVADELSLRNSKEELLNLKEELVNVKKSKESAIQENRRLLDDLSAVSNDCRNARNELELSKRQVDDLKRQLQQYVAEVKRTEDLISKKETERDDLLIHFKTLSQEANLLENSNHTLENEASQTRIQLSLALDHANDLEKQLRNQETVIHSYEKQIADLASQIASLEYQLKQCKSQCERCEAELQHMRDLCLKLDGENSKLKRKGNLKIDEQESYEEFVDKRRKFERLESELQAARNESDELRGLNTNLEDQMHKMGRTIHELENRVPLTTDRQETGQGEAFGYSQQTKQLRHQVASDRFSHGRDLDDKHYPSF